MAVPKKRTGSSAQGHRRSNWKATKPATTTCSHCGAVVMAHTVCTECGYYKGKPASIKHEDYNAVAEEVKPAKKSTKKVKAEEKVEVKAEEPATETVEEVKEETVTEEVKAEEASTEEKDAE